MSSEAAVENGALGSMMHSESLVERAMENVYYLFVDHPIHPSV